MTQNELNQLVAIYRGPVEHEQLLADFELLRADSDGRLALAIPFGGLWIGRPKPTEVKSIALTFLRRGQQVGINHEH